MTCEIVSKVERRKNEAQKAVRFRIKATDFNIFSQYSIFLGHFFEILVWHKHTATRGMNNPPEYILHLFSAMPLLSRTTTCHRGASPTMDGRAGGVSTSPGWSSGPLRAAAAGGALTQPTLLAASASIRGREQRGLLPGPGLMTVMATESRFAETVAGRREAKISH